MAIFYDFPKIHQYKDIVRHVNDDAQFRGTELPTAVTFTGTVKVHGCNVGIGYNPVCGTIWAQSRNHILSAISDMYGFYAFVMVNKAYFIGILSSLSADKPVIAYGEWFGKGIQTGVAVESLQRRLMIFAVKIVDEATQPTMWLKTDAIALFFNPANLIFNVINFPTYSIVIDFSHPKLSQNELVDNTNQVEKECPVGKYFGVSGVGEGIVWHSPTYGRFKVKGAEHSASKVTKLASVDTEKLATMDDFVTYALTSNRLEQGIEQVFTIYNEIPDVKHTLKYVKWITADVFKEETATLTENNLIPEDVNKMITSAARTWFVAHCKKL